MEFLGRCCPFRCLAVRQSKCAANLLFLQRLSAPRSAERALTGLLTGLTGGRNYMLLSPVRGTQAVVRSRFAQHSAVNSYTSSHICRRPAGGIRIIPRATVKPRRSATRRNCCFALAQRLLCCAAAAAMQSHHGLPTSTNRPQCFRNLSCECQEDATAARAAHAVTQRPLSFGA